MAEAESEEHQARRFKNLFVRNNKKLWENFETWIDEEPVRNCPKFQTLKSAMLVHSGYVTIVMDHLIARRSQESESYDSITEYVNFLNAANESNFVRGDDEPTDMNVFKLLSELFSSFPEFRPEVGELQEYLKEKLTLLLPLDLGWNRMNLSVPFFRSVYWQICFCLDLTTDTGLPHSTTFRPQLMFSAFVTAILVSIWHDYELILGKKLPNYEETHEVDEYLRLLVTSPYFRPLSFFLLGGLWMLVTHRREGGHVTLNPYRPSPMYADQVAEFQRCLAAAEEFQAGFDFKVGEEETDRLQKQWEVFVLELLAKGLLKPPEGFRLSKKGGRPRKSNKRKSEHGEDELQLQKTVRRSEKMSPRKQDLRKVPSTSRVSESFLHFSQKPSTSSYKPEPKPTQTAEEVGLGRPIFMVQADLMRCFREDVERRRTEGRSANSIAETEKMVFEAYAEMRLKLRMVREPGQPELTVQQKAVHEYMKRTYRAPPIEPTHEEAEMIVERPIQYEEREDTPGPSLVSPTKPSKRCRRRY